MGSREDPTGSDETGFLQGKLLIAMPGMPDPRFEKSVIYMCRHSSDGAMGIIINKPITGLNFGSLMPKLNVTLSPSQAERPVLFGGPVETDHGVVLHTSDYAPGDTSITAQDGIALTATVEILQAIASGGGPARALLALGYAGWGPGQIEGELQGNGWIHCDMDKELVFDVEMGGKWRAALAKLGADLAGLSSLSGRA